MRRLLFLRWQGAPGGTVSWTLRDARRGAEPTAPSRGSLAEAARAARGHRVVVLVPGEDVALHCAQVPARSRARQARAVPFALEDEIAGEVEHTHFALAGGSGEQVPVAVVDHPRMAAWLEALQDAGLDADWVVPDILALPWEPAAWTLLADGPRVLLRTGRFEAQVLEAGWGGLVVAERLAGSDPAPGAVRVLATRGPDGTEATGATPFEDVFAAHGVALDAQEPPRDVLDWLARGFEPGAGINLLQGPYRGRRTLAERLRPWRPAAALAVLLLAVEGGAQVAEHVRLQREQATLEATVTARFQEAFPEARRIVNPRVQAEGRLRALRGGGDGSLGFLELLTTAAAPVVQAPGARVRSVTYRGGVLYLDLQVPDLQGLDRLKSAIAAAGGLEVVIQTATAQGNTVQSRLRIQEAPV